MDFYVGVLGLRFVKKTVNTFFPWPGAYPGRKGPGQVLVTSFAIRPESVAFWIDRLKTQDVFTEGTARFLTDVMGFSFVGEGKDRVRFAAFELPRKDRATLGTGIVHHIPWRVLDEQKVDLPPITVPTCPPVGNERVGTNFPGC